MTRKSTLGQRIKELRRDSGFKSRAEFARALGVNRTSVVAWENNSYKPKVADCLKITNRMTTASEKVSFLEEAGIDPSALADLAVAIGRSSYVRPRKGEAALVRDLVGNGEPLRVSTEIIPNPSSVRYFRIPEESIMGGDIYFLDVSHGERRLIAPLWGERVLIELRSESLPFAPNVMYDVGRLRLVEGYVGEKEAAFEGMLDPLSDQLHITKVGSAEHLISYRIGIWIKRSRKMQSEDIRRRAKHEMEVLPHVRIIGRVIGWFSSQKREGEAT